MKKVLIIGVAALVIGGGALYYFWPAGSQYEFVRVKKGLIVESVSVTGTVKPLEAVDLAFERAGKILNIYAQVGETVFTGQSLVALDNSELEAQMKEAQASVEAERAKLAELLRGTRPEEIQVTLAELGKANQDLANSYSAAIDILYDAFTKADDAVRNQTDVLFSDSGDTSPKLNFATNDAQAKIDTELQRSNINALLSQWKTELGLLDASSQTAVDSALNRAEEILVSVRSFLTRAIDAVNSATSISQTTATTYKTNISNGRSSVNGAILSINSREQEIASQKLVVAKIQNELDLKLAGATNEQIATQRARVSQAEAQVAVIRAQLEKTVLRSPISGTLSRQDGKLGQVVGAGETLATIISQGAFKIEANIPEADIARVKVNDPATLTLDAFGSGVLFRAKVILVEPAETVIEGVSTYKTTLVFTSEDSRVKSGMTANIDILTQQRDSALIVPRRAVYAKDGENMVRVLQRDGSVKEVAVGVGLKGSDGNIEIRSGIREGDRVVVSEAK